MNNDIITLQRSLKSLSAFKTNCMFIARRKKLTNTPEQPDVSITCNKIERVKTYKCLGLELEEVLSWEARVSAVISNVSKAIGLLRRLTLILPFSTLVLICKSLIQPHLTTAVVFGVT